MYTWNDIVILGDSFCSQRKVPNHWPYRLSNLLTDKDPGPTNPARGYGWGGASWWSLKKQLPFYLKNQPKVLIFCHTGYITYNVFMANGMIMSLSEA